MAKGKKPGRTPEPARPERAPARAPERDPALADQEALGNRALQQRLATTEDTAVGFDAIRDVAFPQVERAILALQLVPREPERQARLVEILERSHLPEERRQVLVDKLQTDGAAARGVREALARWFGGEPEQVRDPLTRGLDGVSEALQGGAAGEEGWSAGDRVLPLSAEAREGSVSGRAEALVRDLADGLPAPEAAPRAPTFGAALQGFIRDVTLAIAFDEEEEEEDWVVEEAG